MYTFAIFCVTLLFYASDASSDRFRTDSPMGVYKKAAVATKGKECAQLGADVLRKNGSAVDAAIATLLCDSVACPQSLGIGGGFLMTIFDAKTKNVAFLNAKEIAPAAATRDMFHGNAKLSLRGGLAVAVPGVIMGLWEAHQRYGKLPWKELFEPTIELCEKGTVVTKDLIENLRVVEDDVRSQPDLAALFINPKTDGFWPVGYKLRRPVLAKTLKALAEHENPVELFYNGTMADQLVGEIREHGGIVTREDFANYNVQWKKPVASKIGNLTMYTSALPGSGVLLAFMMNVIQELYPKESEREHWQKMTETFKYAYAERTKLGDPDFVEMKNLVSKLTSKSYADDVRESLLLNETSQDPEYYGAETWQQNDPGTAQTCVLAPDGSAVSVTSSIDDYLGSKIRSRSTGIILNNQMDDFSSPDIVNTYGVHPSPANFILPRKRPLSSMVPTIVLDEAGNVRLLIGGTGGSKITSSVASAMALHLFEGYTIKEAIDARRIHHQLLPMVVEHESGFSPEVLSHLRQVGHELTSFGGIANTVTGVTRSADGDELTAFSDHRAEGTNAGF